MSYVQLAHVTKRFGKVVAVDDLDLSIEQGECFSMLGPSGCGKTTTLRMIAGFEDLDDGEISVGGQLFSSRAKDFYLPPEKRNFGMVFQAFAVWPHKTVFDNVAFPLQIRNVSRHEIAERTRTAMKHTGLDAYERAYPQELSGGQKQRIALARAIAINPSVMLLDEPLSNLDPKLREEMRFEIKDLQRKFGLTIIFVTHDQSEAMALSDRILVMRDGVVQQIDTPLDVYTRPANRFVFSFIGLSNFVPVVRRGGALLVEGAEDAGAVQANGAAATQANGAGAGHGNGVPAALAGDRLTLACRPSEVDLAPDGEGLQARVKSKAYLGDVVDYRVLLGPTELRVQKSRRAALVDEGAPCRVRFSNVLWYPRE